MILQDQAATSVRRAILSLITAGAAVGFVMPQARAKDLDLSAYTLIFDDEFDGTSLDLTKWQIGTQPNGHQWGSGSYFVTSDPQDAALFPRVYNVDHGILTITANYDPTFVDRQPWKRVWYSGMISTAFSNGRAPSAAIRRGVVEVRQRLPSNAGAWPANWALNLRSMASHGDPLGGVEVDGLEAYNVSPRTFSSNIHFYPPGAAPQDQIAWSPKGEDLSADFHTYDYRLDDTTMTAYLDGTKVIELPLARATDIDKFFWMFNNAEGGNGWPVTQPPVGKTTLEIDYVRIYSGDPDAVAITPPK